MTDKIIAVDFDGTLFTNAWPEVGEPILETIDRLKKEQQNGARIILWTNRVGERLQDAILACSRYGITFDAVNDNLPDMVKFFGNNCRKVFANEYWDDRAITATAEGLCYTLGLSPKDISTLQIYGVWHFNTVPENDRRVLCCTKSKAGTMNIIIGYYSDRWVCGMNSNVVAWMELPKVPEEENEQSDT